MESLKNFGVGILLIIGLLIFIALGLTYTKVMSLIMIGLILLGLAYVAGRIFGPSIRSTFRELKFKRKQEEDKRVKY